MTIYNPEPVEGYDRGLIVTDTNPERIVEEGGNGPVSNDWFYLGTVRYNVHPYRRDLGGYPVRWFEYTGSGL